MSCPSCRQSLPQGASRCPSCGAAVALPVEGSLAPDPASLTPAARSKTEPLREIPALRKRERTWKDEVRDRVRHRRREKAGETELPLFPEPEEPTPDVAADEADELRPATPEAKEPQLDEGDLPLYPATPLPSEAEMEAPRVPERVLTLEDEPEEESAPFPLEIPPREEGEPVERPAYFSERLQAGAIDCAVLLALFGVVLYFASRAAHVPLTGLRPTGRYLFGYLAFLGLVYAGYFTGTTGQTIGKIVMDLRVVDTAGRPPGYLRALLRAVLGIVGIAVLFLGMVPVFFDPARRAFHDRVVRTRVVKG